MALLALIPGFFVYRAAVWIEQKKLYEDVSLFRFTVTTSVCACVFQRHREAHPQPAVEFNVAAPSSTAQLLQLDACSPALAAVVQQPVGSATASAVEIMSLKDCSLRTAPTQIAGAVLSCIKNTTYTSGDIVISFCE